MKKALAILLVYSILMTLLVVSPFTVNADEKSIAATGVTSGTTGDCKWTLDDNGVLLISGNGKMSDYSYTYKNSSYVTNAPWGSSSINTLIIRDGVTNIGEYAFSNCSSLTSVIIGNSVTSIGKFAFYNCTGVTSVTIPDSVLSIDLSAFNGCTKLTSITIGNSVEAIASNTFLGCAGLTRIIVAENNTVYDSRDNCNAIIKTKSNELICGSNNTVIPDSVTSIGYLAFGARTSLTSINIPNSVTSIGSSAFTGCTGLISITIPDSVTSLGGYAFNSCTGLTGVTIGNSVTSIGGHTFYGCASLTSVDIGSSVKSIGDSAFFRCEKLKSVTIPSSVTTIGSQALGYYKYNNIKVDDFTIYGYENTAALTYAIDNGFKFILVEGLPTEPTQAPTTAPLDPTKTTDREIFGDIDGDGVITIVDTTFLQRYTIKAETPYPIGEKMK